jgi:sodium transport system permease protein
MATGVTTFAALLAAGPAVAIVGTPVLLVLYWLFFSGRVFWHETMATRRQNFRATSLSPATWMWGLAAAALFVITLEASIFTLFRLIPFPAEQFAPPPMVDGVPPAGLWIGLILASLVAAICEETAFRGYTQRPLEAGYGPVSAIGISTITFAAVHLNQPWAITLMAPIVLAGLMLGALAYAASSLIPGMIGHAVMDVFNFAYWWWSLIGRYDRRPIFETGPDLDFVVWAGALVVSVALFLLVVRKLLIDRNGRYARAGVRHDGVERKRV